MQASMSSLQEMINSTVHEARIEQTQSHSYIQESKSILQDSKDANRQTYQLRQDMEGLSLIMESKLASLNKEYELMQNRSGNLKSMMEEVQSKVWYKNRRNLSYTQYTNNDIGR